MNPSKETLEKNKAIAIDLIEKLLDGMNYGTLQFEIKKHKGMVGQMIVPAQRSVKYNGTPDAINGLADRMEFLAKNKFTGSFSPAVIYQEGEITRVIFSEYHEVDILKLQKGK